MIIVLTDTVITQAVITSQEVLPSPSEWGSVLKQGSPCPEQLFACIG